MFSKETKNLVLQFFPKKLSIIRKNARKQLIGHFPGKVNQFLIKFIILAGQNSPVPDGEDSEESMNAFFTTWQLRELVENFGNGKIYLFGLILFYLIIFTLFKKL